MRAELGYWFKAMLGAAYLPQRPFKPPVFLFSTRRSASTLLMEMIAGQPGFNYHAQPLDLWLYHPYRKHLPQPLLYQYISLTPTEAEQMRRFFGDLLAGRKRFRSQWNWLHPDYHWQVARWIVKLLNANPLMDWFAQNFDIQVVYLLRHPIPTALSIAQRGWRCVAEAYLQNAHFCETYLEAESVREGWRVLEKGNPVQKFVLEWGLANLAPLRLLPERPWLALTYEELVLRPQAMCRLLAERLDLPHPEAMQAYLERPSPTAQPATRADLAQRGARYLLHRWRQQVLQEDAQAAMRLLRDVLGLTAYSWDSPFPAPELCHFGACQVDDPD
jgi:hypothetical protein